MDTQAQMHSRFTLRFPFELSSGYELTGLDGPVERTLGSLTLKVERQRQLHVLTVGGFDSEADATEFASRIWAGLMWMMLNRHIAFTASTDVERVTYAEDPAKAAENLSRSFGLQIEGGVDGLGSGGSPVVYRSDKKVQFLSIGSPTVTVSTSFESVYNLWAEAFCLPGCPNIAAHSKLSTALELYRAHYYERSSNARLLTLVMALETLAEGGLKPKVALDLLAKWQRDVGECKSQVPEGEEQEALEALERELLFRREKSLRSQVRASVLHTLEASGAPDARDSAQNAVRVYDMRSTLVHEGSLPNAELQWAEAEARRIVQAVLKARFLRLGNLDRASPER